MRDELWFIEFGRGAALPLTPEEAPADGEPVVPCAQGRIVVETARPAPPHFATCSTYRRPLLSRTSNDVSVSDGTAPSSSGTEQSQLQEQLQQHQQQQQSQQTVGGKGAVSKGTVTPQSPATRPEDLGVTPWYLEDYPTTDTSPGPMGNRSSYPSYSYADGRDGRSDFNSTRNSSIESEFPRPMVSMPRKACMDLTTAMALLDETCPNVEPSPSLTPRTPRTPLTPYATRSKRARSKSSDNSSNYSNDRLSDRSFEVAKDKEKKRPFLRKIGISKTEDRPFLAKLTPRILGKPYLEKIGPSKAIERPFLDKIGPSKTLDKFTFDTPRNERKNELRTRTSDVVKNHDGAKNNVRHEIEQTAIKEDVEIFNEISEVTPVTSRPEEVQRKSAEISQMATATFERRRSGKEFLLKMYSFETEDLESTLPSKERNTLHGMSLDDALDSGPSSLPTDNSDERTESRLELEKRPTSVTAELLKCRVTTSEEIISSSTTCLNSPGETNSWNNSPQRGRAQRGKKESATMIRRRIFQGSHEIVRSDDSTPNSPTKRPISSVSPDREGNALAKGTLSPTKTRKSINESCRTVENTRRSIKYNQFERRGISSDNLLAKDVLSFVTAARTMTDNIGRTREISSEDSLATHREYTRETFKQLQEKFKLQEIPMESYAAFKRRTQAAPGAISRQERLNLLPGDLVLTTKSTSRAENVASADTNASETAAVDQKRDQSQEGTVRSILRKQEGIDHPDQESDTNASIRRPKRRIFHEPSQETMDLLTELRKVKSLLKTPSWENLDLDQKPEQMPKRILLTDKEFCLSVERENSVRRPSRMINSLETTAENKVTSNREDKENKGSNEAKTESQRSPGPALFEKKCLSLDYADEEKPQKPEARAISLASTRDLPSEDIDDYPDILICDSKSCSSSVFNSPSEETNKKDLIGELTEEEQPKKPSQNHCAEVDIAIPIDQKINSPKGDIQGRTSDLYEIISPRSTPFRVKKRLGKISVEETVKPENFTLGSKVDCRSVVAQKRTKCFPL